VLVHTELKSLIDSSLAALHKLAPSALEELTSKFGLKPVSDLSKLALALPQTSLSLQQTSRILIDNVAKVRDFFSVAFSPLQMA
jgi:hypothetical protein